jgi:hypothetical protein
MLFQERCSTKTRTGGETGENRGGVRLGFSSNASLKRGQRFWAVGKNSNIVSTSTEADEENHWFFNGVPRSVCSRRVVGKEQIIRVRRGVLRELIKDCL